MTAVLTVLGALGVLRRCRHRHHTFRWIRCQLGYGHSGHRHHFGWVNIVGVPCDLDAPPTSHAADAPLSGSYTITVTPQDIDQAGTPVELSLGEPTGVPVRYYEYLVPRRRWGWRRR